MIITDKIEAEIYEDLDNLGYSEIEIEQIIDILGSRLQNSSSIGKVKEFMDISNQTVRNKPTIPELNEALLRLNLIQEELFELAQNCGINTFSAFLGQLKVSLEKQHELNIKVDGDLVEILDAFTDLQYVLDGGKLAFGFGLVSDEAFEDVHDSNMSKFCTTEEEAKQTVEMYKSKGTETDYKKVGMLYVIYRKSDNKVLKSIHYKPVNLHKYLTPKI